ncbi:MAG: PorT family protein [Bacteroidales bacterium]|nr:PorT family protein [Bacteroidales bacterium]
MMAQGGFHVEKEKNALGPELQTNDQVFFNPDAKTEDEYHFHIEYRLEGGYVQHWQHSKNTDSRLYLHGGRIGMTFDFMLPYRFSIQTGLLYTIAYGTTKQKWGVADEEESYAACNYMQHRVTEHWLAVPIRAYYNIKLWKKLNLFFYGGPQLMIGLYEEDNIKNNLPPIITQYLNNQDIPTGTYNRFKDELYPVNIQIGIGGGLEWDCYRLQAGYDFGLNNQIKHPVADQHLWEWSWFVSFAYKLPVK